MSMPVNPITTQYVLVTFPSQYFMCNLVCNFQTFSSKFFCIYLDHRSKNY